MQRFFYRPTFFKGTDRLTLGFVVLGGPIAWFIHLLVIYGIGEGLCLLRWPTFSLLGISGPRWLVLIGSALLVAIVSGSLRMGWNMKHRFSSETNTREDRSKLFMVRFSLLSNGIFLFVILVETIPVFAWLETC